MSTVREAVEKAEQTDRAPSLAQVVNKAITDQSKALGLVLPAGHDPDRFSRLVLTAVKATPELMECFSTPQGRTSVLLSAMQLATVGLEPNTALQEAWLLPRRVKGVVECQASYGYRGLLKLARRSGEIKTVFADVVHERDEFRWSRGLEADDLHHVAADGDRGDLLYAYAVCRYLNGSVDFVVLNRAQVEARRKMSPSGNSEYGPWRTWPAEMWRKTALRVLSKTMPMSADVARAVASDEAPLSIDEGVIVAASYAPGEELQLELPESAQVAE